THGAGGGAEEVRPSLPSHVGAAHQLEVGLVDQLGRGECGPRRAATDVPPRDAFELVIDEWKEPIDGARVPAARVLEEAGYFGRVVWALWHHPRRCRDKTTSNGTPWRWR